MSVKVIKSKSEDKDEDNNILYDHRSKDINGQYVIFTSTKKLDLEIGEENEEILIKMSTPYGGFNSHKVICYSIINSKVLVIEEDTNGFNYKITGDIEYLKFWKFNDKLK